ncbi:hypothetical protein [Pseudanabaena phage PA-SR01]|nr:hypothetical protein [Pseudanabaena phage PA-SR01]
MRNKSNDYRRHRTSSYAWCKHQRREGKRGAHKLKRLAWREEIAALVEENRLEKINRIEDLVLVLVKSGYKVSKKGVYYKFENDTIFGLFGGEGDYPMSPYTENKICAAIRSTFDKWSTAELLDLEFLDKDAEEILLVLKELEHSDWINP